MPVGGSPARSVRFISRIQAGSLIECPLSDVDVGQLVDGCKVPFDFVLVFLSVAVLIAVAHVAGVGCIIVAWP